MPITATMVGAVLGLTTQMYSNALRKLPYMRRKQIGRRPFPFPCFYSDCLVELDK